MAVPAHSDAFDAALQDVNAKLSMLRSQCDYYPSELEKKIGTFWRTLGATSRSVKRLQNLCTPALRHAIGEQFRKVDFAADAFREHVRRRHLSEDDVYLKSRASLAAWLINELDSTISYFAMLK